MLITEQNNYLELVEKRLSEILSVGADNAYLVNAIRYSVLGGGKRIRPLLSIASSRLQNVNLNVVLDVACAIELIHCYSLVHDDLPAMDNDDLRRGQPTNHKQYDEATAILVGDGLQTLAFEVLSSPLLDIMPLNKLKIIHQISIASGTNGMVGGQMLDLRSTGKKLTLEQLKQMHSFKTGALIKASILCGYLSGAEFSASVYANLEHIADNLGLLFQIVDDILDVTEDSGTLGKTANKDAANDKATYVSLLGLDEARGIAHKLYESIVLDLAKIGNNAMLQELTDSIYKRNH